MADPEKTISEAIHPHPCTYRYGCSICRAATAALDQLVALLAEKDAEIELMKGALKSKLLATPPTRLDRRTRETLEAAGRATDEAEQWLQKLCPPDDWDAHIHSFYDQLGYARSQVVHVLAEDEGEPPVVLTIREEPRCTGYCIFDGDTLTHPDLCCPIHGSEAQAKAKTAGLDRVEWMRTCRASWPFGPAAVLTEQPR